MGGMKDNLSRRRGMYSDTLNGRAVAQCCLKPKPHLLFHPDLRPALIRAAGCDAKPSGSTPRRYPKLPIVVRPPPPKSLTTAPEKPD
jgi:hypothetical protein